MAENQNPPPAPPPLTGLSKNPEADMLEAGESVITVVHRSVIGLVGIYLVAIAAVLAIFGLIIAISPDSFNTDSATISPMLSGIIILGAILLVLILFTATYIYRQSRLLITDRSLVQILQKSLFIRKVSRLSMQDVEDVSAEHRGILASIFGYGTLTVQTAGERENFVFTLCPMPQKYADQIIEARQKFLEDGDDHTP
jgi:uncharacterized membrane protein YdbT with pleckstrin-like domain